MYNVDNLDLTEADSGNNEDDFDSVSSLCAKQGKSYPPTIRKLYYSLLTRQIPAAQVADIVKTGKNISAIH